MEAVLNPAAVLLVYCTPVIGGLMINPPPIGVERFLASFGPADVLLLSGLHVH